MKDEGRISITAASIDEEILHNKELGVLTNAEESWWCQNILRGLGDGAQLTTTKYLEGMERSLPPPPPT